MGTGDGQVQILSSSFKLIRTFSAYPPNSAVGHLEQVEGTSLLVTIGEDLGNDAVLKVWALDQIDRKTGAPKCLSTVTILNGRKRFPVGQETEVVVGLTLILFFFTGYSNGYT